MAKDLLELRLFDLLPDSIAGIKEVQDTAKTIDPEMLSVSQSIREALILSRIDELPEPVLDLLAWQYHVDNYEPLSLPIEQKRAQVRDAILIHRKKGTPWALKQELANIGFPVEVDEDTGQPYIFDIKVLLNGQADTTAVYNAAVNAAMDAALRLRSRLSSSPRRKPRSSRLRAAAPITAVPPTTAAPSTMAAALPTTAVAPSTIVAAPTTVAVGPTWSPSPLSRPTAPAPATPSLTARTARLASRTCGAPLARIPTTAPASLATR